MCASLSKPVSRHEVETDWKPSAHGIELVNIFVRPQIWNLRVFDSTIHHQHTVISVGTMRRYLSGRTVSAVWESRWVRGVLAQKNGTFHSTSTGARMITPTRDKAVRRDCGLARPFHLALHLKTIDELCEPIDFSGATPRGMNLPWQK
jgi:hypothetical protein